MGLNLLVIMVGVMMLSIKVSADPDSLQDVCVADLTSGVKVNGYPCKTTAAAADDFFFAGIAYPGNTNNSMGSLVSGANVLKIPGLNTLGVSLARIDYAPGGLNPPHVHPRATEVVFVLTGALNVGFITTANVLISKTIKQGEVFAFPKGLVHYQMNNATVPAAVLSAFNSQLPGTQSMAAALFTAAPDTVLAKAFMISIKDVDMIQSQFAP